MWCSVFALPSDNPAGGNDNNLLTLLTFDKYQLFLDGLLTVSFREGVFQAACNNGKMPG
jgi:hypothetical protein